jgi:tetratricopeptide (TPR) repeat protein
MGAMTNSTQDDSLSETLPVNTGGPKEQPASELPETQPVSSNNLENKISDQAVGLSQDNPADTLASPANDGLPKAETPNQSGGLSTRWRIVIGLVIFLLIGLLSGLFGYWSGIDIRTQAAVTQVAASLQEQYNLGLQDAETGSWDRARQRFEYIIRQKPDFPGAAEQLALVLLNLNSTATPTPALEPTVTPTPDTRGIDERFQQSEQYLLNGDWTNTIDSLLLLRKDDPTFRAVQIDGMLFMALRNRGMDKIGKLADLEGGIYDLALAERFGPLDNEAQGYLSWARIYLTGASFWEINWEEAVNYFSQIAPQLPYLTDGSGMTAIERYRKALIGLGLYRLDSDPCSAKEPLELALSFAADEEAANALDLANQKCEGGRGSGDESGDQQPAGESTPVPTVEIPPTVESPPTEELPPTETPPAGNP